MLPVPTDRKKNSQKAGLAEWGGSPQNLNEFRPEVIRPRQGVRERERPRAVLVPLLRVIYATCSPTARLPLLVLLPPFVYSVLAWVFSGAFVFTLFFNLVKTIPGVVVAWCIWVFLIKVTPNGTHDATR